MSDRQKVASIVNELDPSQLTVIHSERIRDKRETITLSTLNLLLADKVILSIIYRELDYASSFSVHIVTMTGNSIILTDTELDPLFVSRVDAIIASLPIVVV